MDCEEYFEFEDKIILDGVKLPVFYIYNRSPIDKIHKSRGYCVVGDSYYVPDCGYDGRKYLWEIDQQQLYLRKVTFPKSGKNDNAMTGNGLAEEQREKITWFNGDIMVPVGERYTGSFCGNVIFFENEIYLWIEDGIVIFKYVEDNSEAFNPKRPREFHQWTEKENECLKIAGSYRRWEWGKGPPKRRWIKGSFESFWKARGLYTYEKGQGFDSWIREYDPELRLECMQRWVDILYDEKINVVKLFQDLLMNYYKEFPKLGTIPDRVKRYYLLNLQEIISKRYGDYKG